MYFSIFIQNNKHLKYGLHWKVISNIIKFILSLRISKDIKINIYIPNFGIFTAVDSSSKFSSQSTFLLLLFYIIINMYLLFIYLCICILEIKENNKLYLHINLKN